MNKKVLSVLALILAVTISANANLAYASVTFASPVMPTPIPFVSIIEKPDSTDFYSRLRFENQDQPTSPAANANLARYQICLATVRHWGLNEEFCK